MHYPQFWRKLIDKLGMLSGFLIIIISLFSVMEAFLRYFFDSPTGWALNVCQYLLVYMIFLSSPYAFQEGGHVAVDMILNLIDKHDRSGKRLDGLRVNAQTHDLALERLLGELNVRKRELRALGIV